MRALLPILVLTAVCGWSPVCAADEPVANDNWGSCRVNWPVLSQPDTSLQKDTLEILSGQVELQREGHASFSENIVMHSGSRVLSAQDGEYDFDRQTLSVRGSMEYQDPDLQIHGTGASFNRSDNSARIDHASFQIRSVPARGSSDRIELSGNGILDLHNVTYTSCPPGNDDWLISARRITIDQNTGHGTAKDARFEIRGVPVFYLPYFTYPVSNKRKTGFLIPQIGSSQRRGFDMSVPWYWNIAPNYDATLTPRLMTERGLQMGGEFRYLTGRHNGTLTGEILFNDRATGNDRSLLNIDHRSMLPFDWRASLKAAVVSDANYFEDFGGGLASTSQTHLPRILDLEFFNGPWTAMLRIEDYQTIDQTLTPEQKPYTRLPQLMLHGYQPYGLFGLQYSIEADATYFDRNVGVTGLRAYVTPSVARPFDWRIFELTPEISIDHTLYELNNTQAGQSSSPTRTAPIMSLDLSTSFERYTHGSHWLTTLEPRLLYTYIPFRNQDNLPVFDTVDPDLNIVQLFRKNRFVGHDRLADTNQIALGLTSRLIEADDGIEFLRLTMGQLQFLSAQEVTLPGGAPNTSTSSDYIAELDARLRDRWSLNAGFQWNASDGETRRTNAAVRYQRDARSMANLGYRFRQDSLEELDVSVGWPIGGRWNFVGRYNYSLRENKPLERFAALEYETCCWAIRGTWRRNIVNRNGDSDTSFGFQVVLKGLSDPGTAAEDLLGRGILTN